MSDSTPVLIVAGQPQIFPSMHWLHRAARCHKLVVMDLAQVNRRVGMSRYTVAKSAGAGMPAWPHTMSFPLNGGSRAACNVAKVMFGPEWTVKQVRLFRDYYSRFEKFGREACRIHESLMFQGVPGEALWPTLDAVGLVHYWAVRAAMHDLVEFPDPMLESRMMLHYQQEERPSASDRVLRIVKALGGTAYYCGQPEDRPYLDEAAFKAKEVEVYAQRFNPPIDGNLCWLHYYAMGGPELVRDVLRRGTTEDCSVAKPI